MYTEEVLNAHKISVTKIRKEVLNLFIDKDYALSHHEVMDLLPEPFDRVTIYRTLHKFEESGILHKVNDESGTGKFALCHDCDDKGHNDQHIHFHCHHCGKIFCLDDPTIASFNLPKGFKLNDVSIDLKGVCNQCSDN